MSPSQFDRFMVDVRNGTNFKLAHLSHAHYRAFFSAVVPIAALSKVRGAFMVNGEPATVEHMRLMAPKLTQAECRTALEVFRATGMLEHDEELGGEWVHDFEEWNPEPKGDNTNAERQKRYRDRQRASRNGTVTAPRNGEVTPTEEEEKGKEEKKNQAASPPRSRAGGGPPSLAESVECPDCHAPRGEKCNASRGGKRPSYHLKRHHLVGEMTHITSQKPSAKLVVASKPYAPDPAMVALRDEHFPGEDVTAVTNCAATLQFRRQPVTPEGIRELLIGGEAA